MKIILKDPILKGNTQSVQLYCKWKRMINAAPAAFFFTMVMTPFYCELKQENSTTLCSF